MIPSAKEVLSSLLRHDTPGVASSPGRLVYSNPQTPSPGPATRPQYRHATADFTEEGDDDDDEDEDLDDFDPNQPSVRFADHPGVARRNSNNLLPLFSASHLDSLPVYNAVHAVRIIVQARTETSLSWEQLRSPQVSQFLVKPMQQQIRTQHFSRVTLYALMANCLQFGKEGQLNPGNIGVSSTRAKVCELLALKLLKEYNTRELIDALSYDFDPLQGAPGSYTPGTPTNRTPENRSRTPLARSSTLEVAIRASAKHFIAHPLVVQQLEAIWNGAISFHSSHDNLHRAVLGSPDAARSNQRGSPDDRTPLLGHQSLKELPSQLPLHAIPLRRTVMLYDPRNASPLKLSRLRVPRYRQFISTCSLFILICLFLAVLVERSNRITSLELIFWFWSAGFMLDEVVGFNEQGFSLYIMSYWNIVDLGILLLLVVYYCMRLYGVFLVNSNHWNDLAYEVLAANAILLLPRIFSVLDHYPYFSQLLIAFRFMAEDLMAVFVLIVISCSGFFVFFTLSKNNDNAVDVAYKIFQILMGFTPAAWDVWPEYTFMGRLLLVIFLIICHFLVVTILITVLTNSFMAIASNAKEEHQFLFAINTISMVKNDALFSYVAPANILAWALTPLRYFMTIRQFILLNRWVIKLTHWPLLFCIYFYEKLFLASCLYEPTDLVEGSGHGQGRALSFADRLGRGPGLFSPNIRTREESIAGFQKDKALEEVFRRQPDANTTRTQRRQERRKTQTAIRNWMDQSDQIGEAITQWPTLDSRPSFSTRRMSMIGRDVPRRFRNLSEVRSAASDPADLVSDSGFYHADVSRFDQAAEQQTKDQTDADGDDELVTNDEDEDDEIAGESRKENESQDDKEEDYFTTPMTSRRETMIIPSSSHDSRNSHPIVVISPKQPSRRQGLHSRTLSTNTILYNPQEMAIRQGMSPSATSDALQAQSRPKTSRLITTIEQSAPTGARSPRRAKQYISTPTRPRPIPMKSAPDRTTLMTVDPRRRPKLSTSVDLLDMNSEVGGLIAGSANIDLGAVPASFATQMALATGQLRGSRRRRSAEREREDADRMSRLVLARMKTLEEGFADVVREVQLMRSTVPTAQNSADESGRSGLSPPQGQMAASSLLPQRKPGAGSKNLQPQLQTRGYRKSGRPGSSKEDEEERVPATPIRKRVNKGKGKESVRSYDNTQDEADDEDRGGPAGKPVGTLGRRGSSF
ncbi:hypothetical protein F5Y16DRAFT_354790 [Xylariaceae sp. FL0255]|nr:hypothetical protein F5Y16DRAFT_354790 [Xylariaceae sp. FL0255]